jgi:hypothetical protein
VARQNFGVAVQIGVAAQIFRVAAQVFGVAMQIVEVAVPRPLLYA